MTPEQELGTLFLSYPSKLTCISHRVITNGALPDLCVRPLGSLALAAAGPAARVVLAVARTKLFALVAVDGGANAPFPPRTPFHFRVLPLGCRDNY